NPRSTVGTITEVYDYLRLLWARVGTPHCPNDGSPIERQSASQITDLVLQWPDGTKIEVRAPLVRGRKGEFRDLFEGARKQGFVRVHVDGQTYDLAQVPKLNRRQNHDIAVVVDRLVVRAADRRRLADPSLSILEGVILPWGEPSGYLRKVVLPTLARVYKIDLNTPWQDLPAAVKKGLLHGAPGRTFTYQYDSERWHGSYESSWSGVLKYVEKRYRETASDSVREQLEAYMVEQPCPTCGGKRLRPESLAVLVGGKSLGDVVDLAVTR